MNAYDTLRGGGNLGWLRSRLGKDGLLAVVQYDDVGVALRRLVMLLLSFAVILFCLSTLLSFWLGVGHFRHVRVARVNAGTDRGEPGTRYWLSRSKSTECAMHSTRSSVG